MTTPSSNDPISLLRGLRATREFLPDPVPQEIVNDLLEVARWTGSSMNQQPWEFMVVTDRDALTALGGIREYTGHVAGAPLAIVLVMDGESDFDEAYDEGRLTERIMLAAAAYGLGSCIAWFTPESCMAQAREALGVPEGKTVRTGISIGYADTSATRAKPTKTQARKPLEDLVHVNRYGNRLANQS